MIFGGLPSVIYEIISKISNEAPPFVAGFVSVNLVMVNSSFINLYWLYFCLAMGFQFTCGAVIGNKIGEGNKEGAKRMINASISFAILYAAFSGLALYMFPDFWLAIYAKNEETLVLMKEMLPVFIMVLCISIIKDIMFGVIIGIGAQKETTKGNLILNFGVWLVLMYTMTFYLEWAAEGPWISLAIVGLISCGFFYRIIQNTDLDELISRIKEKSKLKKE